VKEGIVAFLGDEERIMNEWEYGLRGNLESVG